ncbi:hypothetical protein OSB04_019082 [Centaurea solstitialis]|uniref:Uncharacterized protein n=1 Tax=Centaurea solstitialis TaxID=347529 RepID=A0AA38SPM0_9ASTR|nr:hypothetical protein OSB04_019082 [Centaurea solstitialis]
MAENRKSSRNVDREIRKEEESEAISGEFVIENGECEDLINGVEEFKGKPLNLSRCKSLPGRTGDKHFSSFGS